MGQVGCRLRHVSDLFTLGRATIEESLSLLYWAKGKGFGPLGICGLSMGGVHSCMVAALYPENLACTPLLAPRSAAVAFCEGALQNGITNWQPLANSRDTNDQVSLFLSFRHKGSFQDIDQTLLRMEPIRRPLDPLQKAPIAPELDFMFGSQTESNWKPDRFSFDPCSIVPHYYPEDNISGGLRTNSRERRSFR